MLPGVNPVAVKNYILFYMVSYHISYHIVSYAILSYILYRVICHIISYMTPMDHETLQDIKFEKLFEVFKN